MAAREHRPSSTDRLLDDLRATLGVNILNASGSGPMLVILGSADDVAATAAYFRASIHQVAAGRLACAVKVAGVQIRFLGDVTADPLVQAA